MFEKHNLRTKSSVRFELTFLNLFVPCTLINLNQLFHFYLFFLQDFLTIEFEMIENMIIDMLEKQYLQQLKMYPQVHFSYFVKQYFHLTF